MLTNIAWQSAVIRDPWIQLKLVNGAAYKAVEVILNKAYPGHRISALPSSRHEASFLKAYLEWYASLPPVCYYNQFILG